MQHICHTRKHLSALLTEAQHAHALSLSDQQMAHQFIWHLPHMISSELDFEGTDPLPRPITTCLVRNRPVLLTSTWALVLDLARNEAVQDGMGQKRQHLETFQVSNCHKTTNTSLSPQSFTNITKASVS